MHTQKVKVWDIWVRFTHWFVAMGIVANLMITEDGSQIHEYVGYGVVALVVSRLLWGFIGTKYARFSNFFPTPKRIAHHLKSFGKPQDETHLGHNPLGALMMFALWGVIIGLGVSGYLMENEAYIGNLYLGNLNIGGLMEEDWLEEVHEILANSLYLLVPVHIISAVVMGKLQKQNLVKAMITGKKTIVHKTVEPQND